MLLNNVFIKSDIGIDLYKVEKKEFPYYYIKREHKPFIIRGVGKDGRDSIVLEKECISRRTLLKSMGNLIFSSKT